MSELPERPSLELLRTRAKARRRERGSPLSQAQHEVARERMVDHKLDFEDLEGPRWILARGIDVDADRCLHHASSRGAA